MKFICEYLLSLSLISIEYLSITGLTFDVSNYGSYPNDNLDDTNGIQLAINEAIHSGLNNNVVFGFGTYNLSYEITILNANNLTITGQGIDKTFLIGNSPSSIFLVELCKGLTITSLSIDYDPLPFTAGYVVNVNQTYLDLEVKSPHQTNINEQVQAILRYDPIAMRPAFGLNTYEIYQTPFPNSTTTLISPGILRIPLNLPSKFMVGDPIVVRYALQNHVIIEKDSEDLTIESINIYTSWCMGFGTTRTKRLNINNYNVISRNDRWMSTIADCLHFMDTREYISLSNSKCSSMGDDGLNIHATYFTVRQIINSTTLIVQTLLFPTILNVGIGTDLEFSTNQQPFTPHAKGTVISTKIYDSSSQIFTFDSPINVNINDYVVISDTPQVTINNFTVENNRARGILLETRNVNIKNSIFNRTSGPAILFQPSLSWHEGPFAINVTLSQNLFINNNEGISKNKGVISILPDPVQSLPIITNLQITSSTFLIGKFNQGVLQSYNGNNIYFHGNYIATNHSLPFISICNTKNITAFNNTLINNILKIDQYYILDTNTRCFTNLSSLIDLPPSAFNSSFPPPVALNIIV
jgi:hypothetical protein